MGSEQQYIELFQQTRGMICQHSSEVMNAVRDEACHSACSLGCGRLWIVRPWVRSCLFPAPLCFIQPLALFLSFTYSSNLSLFDSSLTRRTFLQGTRLQVAIPLIR